MSISRTLKGIVILFWLVSSSLSMPAFAFWNSLLAVLDQEGKEIIPFASEFSSIIKLKNGFFLARKSDVNDPSGGKIQSKIFDRDGIEIPHKIPDNYIIERVYFPGSFRELQNNRSLPDNVIYALRSKEGSGLYCNGQFIVQPEHQYFSNQVKNYIPVFKPDGQRLAFAINVDTRKRNVDPKFLETLRYDYKYKDKKGWKPFSIGKGNKKRWGYKDQDGKVRIKPRYYHASAFGKKDTAYVYLAKYDGSPGKKCWIDRRGKVVSPYFDSYGVAYNGMSVIRNNGKYELVNSKYEPILKDFAYLNYLYDDVFVMRKHPKERLKAMTFGGKIQFVFPEDVVHVQESKGLLLCSVRDEIYKKFGASYYSTLCLNRSGKAVFKSRKYRKLSFENGMAVLKAKDSGKVSCLVVDKNGPLFDPIDASSINVASPDRFIVWKRDRRFNSQMWKTDKTGWSRPEMFANLLENYDLIGMKRKRLEELIGPPAKNPHNGREFYRVGIGGCTVRAPLLEFEFKDGVVRAWRLDNSRPWSNQPYPKWITENVVYHWPDDLGRRIGEQADYNLYPKRRKSD